MQERRGLIEGSHFLEKPLLFGFIDKLLYAGGADSNGALIRGSIGIQKLTPTYGSECKCHACIHIGVINGLQAWSYSLEGLTLKDLFLE